MEKTTAHCNECAGARNHEILHSERSDWRDDYYGIAGGDAYEMLRCLGCESVKIRHRSWFSEADEDIVRYYPPPIFRREPAWFRDLSTELPSGDSFVETLLREIYTALQNNLPSLAAMGVRSLLEKIMIAKAGDVGSFKDNLEAFEKRGFVSRVQRESLEAILEVGHAAIHRLFVPTTEEVTTLIVIAEHVVESVYLHEGKVQRVAQRVPPRSPTR